MNFLVQKKDESGKKMQNMHYYAGKGLALLFVVMFALTVVSRITASLTVARVMTEKPVERKITHTVTAAGTVEKNLELAVRSEQGLLVKTVCVAAGQKVKAGTILAELDTEQLREQIASVEDEIRILQLTNQGLADAEKRQAEHATQTQERAKEDYEQAVSSARLLAEKAAQQLAQAQEAYNYYAQANAGSQEAEVYEQLFALQQAVYQAQEAYEAQEAQAMEAKKAAERALEDADMGVETDYSMEINNIQIAQKKQMRKELEDILAAGGLVTAPVDAVVTEVLIKTGQKTADTAAFLLADLSSGMRFLAQIAKADARYVSAGDTVTLEKNGRKTQELSIDAAEAQEDGSLTVTVQLDDEMFSIGDTASLTVEKQSMESAMSIPLTAVHEDNGKMFVYVIETRNTVLGDAYYTRRVDITVKDKNYAYASLEAGALTSDSLVVTDSDRYVEAGVRVRLWEQ